MYVHSMSYRRLAAAAAIVAAIRRPLSGLATAAARLPRHSRRLLARAARRLMSVVCRVVPRAPALRAATDAVFGAALGLSVAGINRATVAVFARALITFSHSPIHSQNLDRI